MYMRVKVTSDSFTALPSLPAMRMPPCSNRGAALSCTKAPEPLSVQAAFQGKNVLITGAHRTPTVKSLHLFCFILPIRDSR